MDKPAPESVADVKLEWAYAWRCPECLKRNFAAKVSVEFNDTDLKEILGLDACQPLLAEHYEVARETFMCPAFVRCSRCKKLYRADGPEEMEELDEDFEGELGDDNEEEEEGL